MTDTGRSLGDELLAEIARQSMIQTIVVPTDHGTRFIFKWAATAPEQLEAHIYHILKGRGLVIRPAHAHELFDEPNV